MNSASDGCARQNMADGLDLIFTDIMGVLIIAERSGLDYSRHKLVFLAPFNCSLNFYSNYCEKERE